MRRTQSMGDLLLISPDIIIKGPQPDTKGPPTNDDGWLVKIRTNRYLENARNRLPSRTRSVGDLSRTPKQLFASDRIQISQTLQKVTEDCIPKLVLMGG
uniref:Uncharacterized protein n=1 Tax=Panagrolaimus superbus TaxID=310955 RepID=A0A914YMJ8_9BILA